MGSVMKMLARLIEPQLDDLVTRNSPSSCVHGLSMACPRFVRVIIVLFKKNTATVDNRGQTVERIH